LHAFKYHEAAATITFLRSKIALTPLCLPDELLPLDDTSFEGLGDVSFLIGFSPSREYRSPLTGDPTCTKRTSVEH
jgi:hypothetical protein